MCYRLSADTGMFYVLDFGFAKEIKKLSTKTHWGPSPNLGSLWSLLFNPMQVRKKERLVVDPWWIRFKYLNPPAPQPPSPPTPTPG